VYRTVKDNGPESTGYVCLRTTAIKLSDNYFPCWLDPLFTFLSDIDFNLKTITIQHSSKLPNEKLSRWQATAFFFPKKKKLGSFKASTIQHVMKSCLKLAH
jgi:hypothetical protein